MSEPRLYLREVAISNFRSYGPDFRITLPNGPGITVLNGPNGLGKTSFFDAIEWALTSRVGRLDLIGEERAPDRELIRRAADADGVRVQLSYSGSEERTVVRTGVLDQKSGVVTVAGTPVADVSSALRSPDDRWALSPENFPEYLYLTHFHPQSSIRRLVSRRPQDRWSWLSLLAGTHRFDRVRANLVNSKSELTSIKRSREEICGTVSERLKAWRALLALRDDLRKEAEVLRDAVSPDVAAKELRALLSHARLDVPPAVDEADVLYLGRMRAELDQAHRLAVERQTQLAAISDVPQLWTVQRTELMGLERALQDRAKQSAELTDKGRVASETLAATTAEEEKARKESATSGETIRKLQRLSNLREERDRIAGEAVPLGAQSDKLAKELQSLESQQNDKSSVLAGLQERRAVLAALRERSRLLEATEERWRRAASLLPRIEQERLNLASCDLELTGFERRLQVGAAELTELGARVASLGSQVSKILEKFGELQKAVAIVSNHVHDDTPTCPVCRTPFAPGELRAQVSKALAAALDPAASSAEEMLNRAQERQAALQEQLRDLAVERDRCQARRNALVQLLAELDTTHGKLLDSELLRGTAREDVSALLARLKDSTAREIKEQDAAAPDDAIEAAERELRECAARKERVVGALALARQGFQTLSGRSKELDERISELETFANSVSPGSGLGASLAAASRKFEVQRETELALQVRRQEIERGLQELRQRESQLQQSAVLQRKKIEESRQLVGQLQQQWRSSGLAGEPSAAVLDREQRDCFVRLEQLATAVAHARELAASVERWRRIEELTDVEGKVRQELGGQSESEYAVRLEAELIRAQEGAAIASRAREAADRLSEQLNDVAKRFSDNAVKPIGELFLRYLCALVVDDRYHEIAVAYRAGARSGRLDFLISLGDGPQAAPTRAEFVLSEGQLADLSLAALFASSTAYPWSRWRCLLLDDPTQYNDLIHSTALFDVLRNLVLFQKYQIVISTHDSEQAQFLCRKLESASVPWVEVRFLSNGPEGLYWRESSSEAA